MSCRFRLWSGAPAEASVRVGRPHAKELPAAIAGDALRPSSRQMGEVPLPCAFAPVSRGREEMIGTTDSRSQSADRGTRAIAGSGPRAAPESGASSEPEFRCAPQPAGTQN